jgi:hypothetical protein
MPQSIRKLLRKIRINSHDIRMSANHTAYPVKLIERRVDMGWEYLWSLTSKLKFMKIRWSNSPSGKATEKNNRTNSVDFSPQANYTEWATATCWRNLVPTLWIEGSSVVSAAVPPRSLISVFQTGAATFLSTSSSFILTRAECTPFQTHY